MYSRFQLANKYLQYYFTASNSKGHGMHSPFVFNLITKVLNDKQRYPGYEKVESLRRRLLKDDTVLPIEDFGAGSSGGSASHRTISAITRNAAKSAKYGQLLFRMARYYQPGTILELGTSLGLTTCYLSLGNPNATVITMEGAGAVAAKARTNFDSVGCRNISLVEGNFDDTLAGVINQLNKIDLAFIDGNHRREPTLSYFKQIQPVSTNDSILIFDDIHWSQEMEAAWEEIRQHEAVRCTIDLFFVGIVLFRGEFKEKQHFTVRF